MLFDAGLSNSGEVEVWKNTNHVGDYRLSKRTLNAQGCLVSTVRGSLLFFGVCSWVYGKAGQSGQLDFRAVFL
jgi:hypothetical protein